MSSALLGVVGRRPAAAADQTWGWLGSEVAVSGGSETRVGSCAEWSCIVDGRLERSDELAADLGVSAATEADLIATGLAAFGEALLGRLRGEFAILAWNRSRGSGIAVKDRLGSRPLHFASLRPGLVLGSEIRDILSSFPVDRGADELMMAAWLSRGLAAPERTLLKAVKRIPAGHLLRFDAAEQAQISRWHHPPYLGVRRVDGAEAAEVLLEGMRSAVSKRVSSLASPAVMLSGGLDSAAVAALCPCESRPQVFSMRFPRHPQTDESRRITDVRSHLGLTGPLRDFVGGSALAGASTFISRWGVPPVTPNLFVWAPLLSEAADLGTTTLLDGEGGDELFGLSTALIAERLRSGRIGEAWKLSSRIPGMGENPRRGWIGQALREYGMRGAIPASQHAWLRRMRGTQSSPKPWLSDRARALAEVEHDPDASKRGEGPLWWRTKLYTLGAGADLLGVADEHRRQAEIHGLEFAHPWRDPDLIDLVLELRPELFFDPSRDRPLVRDALRGLLPESSLQSDAKPVFNTLLSDSLRGEDSEALHDLLLDSPPDELGGLIDPEGTGELLTESTQRPAWTLDVWRLASLALWLRERAGPPRHDPIAP